MPAPLGVTLLHVNVWSKGLEQRRIRLFITTRQQALGHVIVGPSKTVWYTVVSNIALLAEFFFPRPTLNDPVPKRYTM